MVPHKIFDRIRRKDNLIQLCEDDLEIIKAKKEKKVLEERQ